MEQKKTLEKLIEKTKGDCVMIMGDITITNKKIEEMEAIPPEQKKPNYAKVLKKQLNQADKQRAEAMKKMMKAEKELNDWKAKNLPK